MIRHLGWIRSVSSAVALILFALTLPALAAPSDAAAPGTRRVSISSSGQQANDMSSWGADISADGRFVVFASGATNLVRNDTNGEQDVFVRNVETGKTVRISVSSAGVQGDGPSVLPSISADGRYVVFLSAATNLVKRTTPDFNPWSVFLRDRKRHVTTRIDRSMTGSWPNGDSWEPEISSDGRYVVFESAATDLVPGDTNGTDDVFIHDRAMHTTRLVSLSTTGAQGDGASGCPSISANDRWVAFCSGASNFDPNDTNGVGDVFLRNLATGTTTRISVSSAGVQGDFQSFKSAISATGRFVAYQSAADTLIPDDTNFADDIFLFDRRATTTQLVSVSPTGKEGNGNSAVPSISADGRFVTFLSDASNLVPRDTNKVDDIFVRDLLSGTVKRVSVSGDLQQANERSEEARISADGRYVTFLSYASNLVPRDTNGVEDVFVRGPLRFASH